MFEVAEAQFEVNGVVQPVAQREQGADDPQPHAFVAGVEHRDEPVGGARHVLREPPHGLGDEVGPHLCDELAKGGVRDLAGRGAPRDAGLLGGGGDCAPGREGEGERNIFFG